MVMAEMARVVRPDSGRAILLVAQPHLLGIPELQRDNRKDRKKLRKKERLRAGHRSEEAQAKAVSEEHERREKRRRGTAMTRKATSGCTSDFVDQGQRENASREKEQETSRGFSSENVLDMEPQRDDERRSVAAKTEPLWRVRCRHVVNVGGLISHLVVLDRTNELSPLPRSDRAKHVGGMAKLCKHRNEKQDQEKAGYS